MVDFPVVAAVAVDLVDSPVAAAVLVAVELREDGKTGNNAIACCKAKDVRRET